MDFAQKNYGFNLPTTTLTDYNCFGMEMEGRTYSESVSSKYPFGFQGQQSEDELYGEGNASFFKYRISDNRLGRFFSIDPLAAKYPHNSPYAFSENRVIDAIELEGLESLTQTTWIRENWMGNGKTEMVVINSQMVYDYSLPQSNNFYQTIHDETTGETYTMVWEGITVTAPAKSSEPSTPSSPTPSSNDVSTMQFLCGWMDGLNASLQGSTYGDGEDWITGGGFGVEGNFSFGQFTYGMKLETYSTTEWNVGLSFDIYQDIRLGVSGSENGWGSTFTNLQPSAGGQVYMYGQTSNSNSNNYGQFQTSLGPVQAGGNTNGKYTVGVGVSTGSSSGSSSKMEQRLRTSFFKGKTGTKNLQGGN